ncbi:hypothetical protein [Nitratireductor sp. GCM10026969]|uniref:hypothetical protein n=1 Tax=Nitratireductor sp. GCM10026969 TaxID=3252645 RepID=UPI00360B2254
MLETGSDPVDAIGREVGYEDAASFRRLTGISPGDYRRPFRIAGYAGPLLTMRGPTTRC